MGTDILKNLTETHPSCRTAVFADLAHSMVLISESRGPAYRETLQALCQRGRALLTAVDGDTLDPETCCDMTLVSDDDGLAVFLRLPHAPDTALCCLCDPELDLESFLPAARDCLERLDEAGT